ncbi:hypothetical protein CYMTET_18382 [Cymbomonas tetramitiformis]|uniref:Uncharacterized protein n=1 Tax=Cymbomonas tetramitiformis TaxID=36881 RepID=A0AAE0G8U3_9CHLO|nr:hypothetical protein CYMTET_18382 [Cymbomonas tetramitiformis]
MSSPKIFCTSSGNQKMVDIRRRAEDVFWMSSGCLLDPEDVQKTSQKTFRRRSEDASSDFPRMSGGWFLEDATIVKAPVAPFSFPLSVGYNQTSVKRDDDDYRGIPYTGRKAVQSTPTNSDDSGTGAVTWSNEKLPDSDDPDDASVIDSKEKLPDSDDKDDAGVTDSKHDMDTASPKWDPASPEYDDTEDDVSEFDDLVADDAEEQAEARKLKRLGLQLIMDDKGELIWVPKGISPDSMRFVSATAVLLLQDSTLIRQ